MSSIKDNNISNSNNKKDKFFSSNSKANYDNKSAKQIFEDELEKFPELRFKRKPPVRNKIKISYYATQPLFDAIEAVAKATGEESKVAIIDRLITVGLRHEFPDIHKDYEVASKELVLRPLGRPGKRNDGGSDPEP